MTLRFYEVQLPYHQRRHYTVEANSPEEAIKLVESGVDLKGEQISEDYSTGCGPNAKIRVITLQRDAGVDKEPRSR